jgi:exopolysaccharide biosynthesis polyprenyl glycosylphosphotransferase
VVERFVAECSRTFFPYPDAPGRDPFALAAGGRARLALSSRAPALFRRHVLRDLMRIGVLVAVDGVMVILTWTVVGALWPDPLPLGNAVAPGQFAFAVVLGLAYLGCYGAGDQRRDGGGIVRATAVGVTVAMWSVIWHRGVIAMLPLWLVNWLAVAAMVLLARRAVEWLVRLVRPTGEGVVHAVVLGRSDEALRLIDDPTLGETPWCRLVAFFDPEDHPDTPAADLARLVRGRQIDTIIIAGALSNASYAMALEAAMISGCQVLSFPRVSPTQNMPPRLVWRDGTPVMELTRPEMIGFELMIKRALDIVVSLAALVLLAPLLALVAWLIRRDSDGPVFFRQARVGQGGRPFTIFKFRTMVVDSDSGRDALQSENLYHDARLFKMRGDPRITRLGAWLRRTSIDEIPQLWNVLRGDMSLVGPRPPMPSEVDEYEAKDFARFDVKPGITGPWQVSGRNQVEDFDEVVRMETAYIRRWNIWLDLELLARTVPAVLSGRGAH